MIQLGFLMSLTTCSSFRTQNSGRLLPELLLHWTCCLDVSSWWFFSWAHGISHYACAAPCSGMIWEDSYADRCQLFFCVTPFSPELCPPTSTHHRHSKLGVTSHPLDTAPVLCLEALTTLWFTTCCQAKRPWLTFSGFAVLHCMLFSVCK